MQQMTFVEQKMIIIAKSRQGGEEGGTLVLTMCALVCNDELSDCLIILCYVSNPHHRHKHSLKTFLITADEIKSIKGAPEIFPLLEELHRGLDCAVDLLPMQISSIFIENQTSNHHQQQQQTTNNTATRRPQLSHLAAEPELPAIVSNILGLSSISNFSSDSSHMKLLIFFAILF